MCRRTPRRRRGRRRRGVPSAAPISIPLLTTAPAWRPRPSAADGRRRPASRDRRGTAAAAARPASAAGAPVARSRSVTCSFCCAACSSPASCAFEIAARVDVADQRRCALRAARPSAACARSASAAASPSCAGCALERRRASRCSSVERALTCERCDRDRASPARHDARRLADLADIGGRQQQPR